MFDFFDLYGIQIEKEAFFEMLHQSGVLSYDIGDLADNCKRFKSFALEDDLSEILNKEAELEIYLSEIIAPVYLEEFEEEIEVEIEMIYIGRSWKNIKDHETGKAFKQNIESAIAESFDFLDNGYLLFSDHRGIFEL